MIGHPKYKLGDIVNFKCEDSVITAVVCVVDAFGTFEQNEEVSYDLKNSECLYKHFIEPDIIGYVNDKEITIPYTSSLHMMRLYNAPFQNMKNGDKTIEFRLWDEKRRKLKPGDVIVFSRTEQPDEKIVVEIEELYCAENFAVLQEKLEREKLLSDSESFRAEDMRNYYSEENEKKYGVVGIKIKLL